MLNLHQQYILNLLLDKFEKRKDYGKGEKSKRRTILHIERNSFPDYYHISDSSFRRNFNADAMELEGRGYLKIDWVRFKENDEISRLYLLEENIIEIYKQLERISKKDKYLLISDILVDLQADAPDCLESFYTEVMERLNNFEALPSIIKEDSQMETEEALYGLHKLLKNNKEIPRRNWSIQLYNDSKKWEKIQGKILNVVRKYVLDEEKEILDDNQLLGEYGIIKNPHHIHLSGNFVMTKGGKTIDLSTFTPDIGLDPRFINECKIEKANADAVITIENLTSYYDYLFFKEKHHSNEIVLYLGGYHNNGRRVILNKLKYFFDEQEKEIPFYHWGDMDMYGMYIWNHLCEKTGIDFLPMYMDRETYSNYVEKGKQIRDSDIKQLEKLLEFKEYAVFWELIEDMLKCRKVIEQEAVVL